MPQGIVYSPALRYAEAATSGDEAEVAHQYVAKENSMSDKNNRQQSGSSGNWGASGAEDMLKGQWNQFKGQIKQHWGQLTDDDLMKAQGNFDQLVGLIQQRTGQSKMAIERELQQLMGRQPESEGSTGMGSGRSTTGGTRNS